MLHWHPKYKPYLLSAGELVLLGEKQSFFFNGERFQVIINGVDGNTSVETLLAQANDHTQAWRLRKTVEHLLQHEILVANDSSFLYFLPELPNATTLAEFELDTHLYNFSSSSLPENLIRQLISGPVTLAIVDDYLQPSIGLLAQTTSPFLLIKLTGERLLIGPYLTLQSNTPCWQCLTDQMLTNQPVRKWVQAKENTSYIPLPVFFDGSWLPAEKINPIIQQALNEPYTLFEVNRQDFSIQKHVVHRRPQCPNCGDPHWVKTQLQQPVSLQYSGTKIANDGGSRATSANDTVKSLQHLVSPITGVITNLMELPAPITSAIKIYRTGFFRTPPSYKAINQSDFVQISLGKGIDVVQSQASALCETIERFAAQYQGDECWQYVAPSELDARYYTPSELVQFSEEQFQYFSKKHQTIEDTKFATQRYELDTPLNWVPTWSVTNQARVYIPFNYGFANTPFEADDQFICWNSNGCAAGNTLEEAILQGFFELIERDATAIWWYNKIETQAINLNGLPKQHAQKFEEALQDWHYWVLNITNDLDIPVMAGVAQHKDTGKFCLGFGCHLNATIACQRALAELCQLIPIRDQNGASFDFNAIQVEAFLMPQGKPRALDSFAKLETPYIKEDILWCVKKFEVHHLEILVLNYCRPNLPIKTVKVIIPGLCHIWPQLGAQRLYSVPLKMGWLTEPKTEVTLNPLALCI